MKAKELNKLNADELNKKLKELKEELFNLRFQAAMGQLNNPLLQKRYCARPNYHQTAPNQCKVLMKGGKKHDAKQELP